MMPQFADLAALPEDDRIAVIAQHAVAGNIVAILLEDDGEKIERYINKLVNRFPKVRHISTELGIAPDTVTVKMGPLADN